MEDEREIRWQARLERERSARREAERLLEEKSAELYQANLRLSGVVDVQASGLRRRDDILLRLSKAFLRLGDDYEANIEALTALCGELFGATAAYYHRVDDGLLRRLTAWRGDGREPAPPSAPSSSGHVCHEILRRGGEGGMLHLRDLQNSPWAETDPGVRTLGLQTYIGHPVTCGGESVASLCVVYDHDRGVEELERQVLEVVSTAMGIEEDRRRSMEDLRERTSRFEAVFQASMDGIVLHDLEGWVVEVNPKFCEMLGYPREEVLGRSMRELHPPEEVPHCCSAMKRVVEVGSHRFECAFRRADGTEFPAEVATRVVDLAGGPVLQSILRDITALREAFAEIERARDEAESANAAKTTFLANISHEIRTPMNGILGFTDLLAGTRLDIEQKRFVQMVQRSGAMLLRIIDDLLDISRIERGMVDWNHEPVALRAALEEMMDLHAKSAGDKGVELDLSLGPDLPPWVAADGTRLRQILSNLVGNAIKFTSVGCVSVRVRSLGGRRVRFEVLDTGIGLEGVDLERIFQPFRQADETTSRRFGGTGLGLAIARALVAKAGGTIGASPRVGGGSVFWFELDLSPATPQEDSIPELDVDFTGRRVLVVDDVAVNRDLLQARLVRWGFEVETVEGGEAALRAIESGGVPDVLLFDEQMPEMDGRELSKRTAELLGDRLPPMLLLTSSGLIGRDGRIVRGLFDVVMAKPADYPKLKRELARLLGMLAADGVPLATDDGSAGGEGASRKRVLVFEDQAINARLLGLLLERLGIEVLYAENGFEGLEIMSQDAGVDLILMDMRMPEMDGLEATRRIRAGAAGDHYRTIPIIGVTANALDSDRAACIEAGMDHYLTKPVQADQLVRALRVSGLLKS